MRQRIEEVTVTVGQVTKEFQVIASDVKPTRPGRYKFGVKVRAAGLWKNLGFFQATGFRNAAEIAFCMHY